MNSSRADLFPEEGRALTNRTPATDMAALICNGIMQMRHLCQQFQHNINASLRDSLSDDLQTRQRPHRCDPDHPWTMNLKDSAIPKLLSRNNFSPVLQRLDEHLRTCLATRMRTHCLTLSRHFQMAPKYQLPTRLVSSRGSNKYSSLHKSLRCKPSNQCSRNRTRNRSLHLSP